MTSMLITLSGPSGAGKTTLSAFLKSRYGGSELPSYTTRPRRQSETSDYYRFLSGQEYAELSSRGEFALEDEFCNAKYRTRGKDLAIAIHDDKFWIADFTCASVIDSIRSGHTPSLALFLYISKALSQERMRRRGDEESGVQTRIDGYFAELETGVQLATLTQAVAFVDASHALAIVQERIENAVNSLKR